MERSLVELIRYETKTSYEEYHHVLKNFRETEEKLDYKKSIDYAKHFRSYKKILNMLQNSIM